MYMYTYTYGDTVHNTSKLQECDTTRYTIPILSYVVLLGRIEGSVAGIWMSGFTFC